MRSGRLAALVRGCPSRTLTPALRATSSTATSADNMPLRLVRRVLASIRGQMRSWLTPEGRSAPRRADDGNEQHRGFVARVAPAVTRAVLYEGVAGTEGHFGAVVELTHD